MDILIVGNDFGLKEGDAPAILVEDRGDQVPERVSIIRNRFSLPTCRQEAIACRPEQCLQFGNDKSDAGNRAC